jgi:hypothetical protein
MTDLRTAAQQALEALEQLVIGTEYEEAVATEKIITALRAALEQPEQEQEPVAIVSSVTEPGQYGVKVRWLGGFPQIAMKLYTHPPRREWRWLSEEERADILFPLTAAGASDMECARAVEAALRSKNHD